MLIKLLVFQRWGDGKVLDLRMLSSNMTGKRFLMVRVDRKVSRVMSEGEQRNRGSGSKTRGRCC